ncbi:MAG: hypothetical protein AB1606_08260 [Nitrospirota bacterium]
MAKSMLKSLKVSDPKVLIGLSVFFVLIGRMIIDPLAGFICFVVAGILAFLAALYGTRRLRYIAFFLFVIIIALAVSKFPDASHHLKVYRSKAVTRGVK